MTLQNTISKKISCTGTGLHSGQSVNMSILPAEENSGITFIRKDITNFNPVINADYRNVSATTLGTTISNDDGTIVSTIEHLMAALWGCGVDNATIELDGAEVPIMDGSSEPFVFLIECANVVQQSAKRKVVEILKKVEVIHENKKFSVSPDQNFSVDFEIDFDHQAINKQKSIFHSSDFSFKTDLCRARTFGFEHEVEQLRSMGLARGGSLENAIVVGKDGVINKEGLRYNNEFVRHKILDCIGDIYLSGSYFKGKFLAVRSGHELNNKLLHKLFADKFAWQFAI